MRPTSLGDFVGQDHLLGEGQLLSNMLRSGNLASLILWGPPGTGKTTLARILAEHVGAEFVSMSAVTSGVQDIRREVSRAEDAGELFSNETVLFVDEMHRFDKNQQDTLLPHVETGTITLIGATTENPSFEVNSALLSRCKTLVLEPLDEGPLGDIVDRAMHEAQRGLGGRDLELTDEARDAILGATDGDARTALNTLEIAADAVEATGRTEIRQSDVEEAAQQTIIRYDKEGEEHYNVVSAFIKSMRGSDPDAALYYMNRMLEGGEDPKFVMRRILIFASEDVGNADPQALQVATSAMQAFEFMGMPEGGLPMTQAVTYLATAPKSNAVIESYGRARKAALEHGDLSIPDKLLNAPTDLHEEMGHGRGYKYPHNFSGNYVAEEYLPDELRGDRYYEPSKNGYEAEIKERLRRWRDEQENDRDE